MTYSPVSFDTWLYHVTFHRQTMITNLGEEPGKCRRYCSCGISWRENETVFNGMKTWNRCVSRRFNIWLPRRGATAYEWQLGKLYGGWVHLKGGHWKHWYQPSRFYFSWEKA